ncbi:MAG: hypothetical protein U0637_06770 [Phycisphaerales bacterium]
MSNVAFSGAVRQVFKQSKNMPPVGKGKNPLVGFAMGFCFGPFGVGAYLRSWGDFFVTLAIVLGGTFVTGGVAAPVLWCICGAFAYTRIRNSNSPLSDPAAGESADTPLFTEHPADVSSHERENVIVRGGK